MVMTIKQKKFVQEYQETGNASKAAKAAYNITTDQSARAVGYENLTKPHIRSALESNVDLFESAIVKTVKDWKDSNNTRRREIAMHQAQYGHDKVMGKAKQSIETRNTSVEVHLDLSGTRVGVHYVQAEATPVIDAE